MTIRAAGDWKGALVGLFLIGGTIFVFYGIKNNYFKKIKELLTNKLRPLLKSCGS
ncbi:MAG: hypothetical protein ABIF92_00370 [archaeon]